jgi:XRE family aerobic/anaerobic benzoate catabolism transcriptional regulator
MSNESAPWKAALGHRCLTLRQARGLTRKALSSSSGLSARFLLELESGRANPSLGSLHDLAGALGVDVIALLERARGPRPIALLGLRGAGKSTLGKRVAHELGWPFVELDREIEREAGMKLAELFALHGEHHYRTLEHRTLSQLLQQGTPVVIATGGGLVTHPESFELAKSGALTVWLKATPQEHWDRVLAQGDERPMARRTQARTELEALYRSRAPLYAQAALIVDTSALDEAAAAKTIADRASHPLERSPDHASHAETSRSDAASKKVQACTSPTLDF